MKKKLLYGVLIFFLLGVFLIIVSEDKKEEKVSQQKQFQDSKKTENKIDYSKILFTTETLYKTMINRILESDQSWSLSRYKEGKEAAFISSKIATGRESLVISRAPDNMQGTLQVILNCRLEKINCFQPVVQQEFAKVFQTIFSSLKEKTNVDAMTFIQGVFKEAKDNLKSKRPSISKDHVVLGNPFAFLINFSCIYECKEVGKTPCSDVSYCHFSIYPFDLYSQYYKNTFKAETINVFVLDSRGNFKSQELKL